MKITGIETIGLAYPTKAPFYNAIGKSTQRCCLVVLVHTDEGITGLGSAAPLGFVTGETLDTCYLVMKRFAEACAEEAVIEKPAKLEGRNMLMFLAPKSNK